MSKTDLISNEKVKRNVSNENALAKYSLSLPETVMKCWPFGDPWAWTTATWAVTCCPWFWSLGDALSDSATRICESLESDDSKGTTSITLTLPEGAVWRIIFFCLSNTNYAILKSQFNYTLSTKHTWLKFTWCKATGVICVARWTSDKVLVVFDDVIDVLASESSFDTEVTVMKFLAVANRVAIIKTQFNYTIRLQIRNSVQIKLLFCYHQDN